LEPKPTQDAGISSQPHSYASMPNFTYELDYQNPYLVSPQIGYMQDYFGYIAQSMYHMNLNQQIFQTRVNNEFTNINNEISTIKGNLTRMEDWQHNLQTNWVNKYENLVDNTDDIDFDLEPGNIDMEMADDPSIRGQEEEDEEEEETEMAGEQEVAPVDPPDQAWRLIFYFFYLFFLGFPLYSYISFWLYHFVRWELCFDYYSYVCYNLFEYCMLM
jgi:hypothetical protein